MVTVLAAATLAVWWLYIADAFRGRREIVWLRDVEPPASRQERSRLPAASVVVAARNEERGIEAGVESLLRLEYPELEVIVVDDRSEDRTGEILDRIAAAQPRLRVIHLGELPEGWLGKNHALQVGADAAAGEVLLFTDADVVMEPTVLARAVARLQAEGLDHLPALADIESDSPGVQLFVAAFGLLFSGYLRPWRAADPDSDVAVGVGGFNLVRRRAWERAGTHAAIRMRPDDDLRLGRAIKRAGGRQRVAVAGELVRVEWYRSLGEAIRGLEKNSLAAVDYSLPLLAAGTAAGLAMAVWPFIALLVTGGAAWWLNLAVCGSVLAVTGALASETSLPAWTVPAIPVGVLLVQFATVRAAWLTHRRGGIRWRGTFYPLEELR